MKPTNKKRLITRVLIGVVLVGAGGILAFMYGNYLKAGVYSLPSNPFLPGTQPARSTNTKKLTCQLNIGQKEYLTRSLQAIQTEIGSIAGTIAAIERIKETEEYRNNEDLQEHVNMQLAYFREQLTRLQNTKGVQENELRAIERLLKKCNATIDVFEPPIGI